MKLNLLDMTCRQLAGALEQHCGKGEYHAANIYRAAYARGQLDLKTPFERPLSPMLQTQLNAILSMPRDEIVDQTHQGSVTKFVSRLADGLRIESVVVPMTNHTTVCVSVQVGCRMGCRFCETARMGFVRQMTAAEIVSQVVTARLEFATDLRNVVFMGMGEPLDNFDAVNRAIGIIADQRGLNIAERRMTLSTIAPAGGFDRLAALGPRPLKLSLSLNAANDRLRRQLMPAAADLPLADLKQRLIDFPIPPKGVIMIGYVVIDGVNDQRHHAAELAAFVRPLRSRINLIPYNPGSEARFASPTSAQFEQFRQWLVAEKVFVRPRTPKGLALMAACGQLGAQPLKGQSPP